ncbi:MAG: peptidoglycan editing factor PgeF [Granulosicoccaceae bacterium]
MSDASAPIVIAPDWALSARVHVASSTRSGGTSSLPYDSLNLGLHVGDDEATVRDNRAWLSEQLQLPTAPRWLNQVHGINVCRLSADQSAGSQFNDTDKADAGWTNTPGAVVAVMTADCLPVVIANEQETAVAVAHAGWRGLADGVLKATCKLFAPDDKLHAWLGPAIGPTAFEVGEDVLQAFVSRQPSNRAAFVDGAASGKYFADIYQLARNELASIGDITVTGGDHCTVSEPSLFFSHRRDGVRSGRMATLAWLA